MKLWADWLADNPRDHARCPGLTVTHALNGKLGQKCGFQGSEHVSDVNSLQQDGQRRFSA
jgi:hypothetical protein